MLLKMIGHVVVRVFFCISEAVGRRLLSDSELVVSDLEASAVYGDGLEASSSNSKNTLPCVIQ
jgi:hypothetical protein